MFASISSHAMRGDALSPPQQPAAAPPTPMMNPAIVRTGI
jgi:hypothetical protein